MDAPGGRVHPSQLSRRLRLLRVLTDVTVSGRAPSLVGNLRFLTKPDVILTMAPCVAAWQSGSTCRGMDAAAGTLPTSCESSGTGVRRRARPGRGLRAGR